VIDPRPSSSVASQPDVRVVVMLHRQRRLRRLALGVTMAASFVLLCGSVITGALSVTGTGGCLVDEAGDTICVKRTWWPFTIQQRAELWTKNGAFDGPRMEWHRNGQLWFSGEYENNVRVGPWVEYWPNGQVRFAGHHVDGKLHGTEQWFFPDGSKEWEVSRVNSAREGVERWYWPNGVLRRQGTYVNGEKEGVFSGFSDTSVPSTTRTYRRGVPYDR